MKKITVILFALMLTVFTVTAAFAQTETVTENVILWSDIAPMVEESGLEGNFASVADLGIVIWIPVQLQEIEIPDEYADAGYIAMLMTSDEQEGVLVLADLFEGGTLEDAAALLSESDGIENVELGIINGIQVITFTDSENDGFVVGMLTDAEYLIEFIFVPASDENFMAIVQFMAASIQVYEE